MSKAGTFTVEDFAGAVEEVIEASRTFPSRSLDEFLRAVWASFGRHRAKAPSWFLFAQLMKEGLSAPPAQYDETWSGVTKYPANPWFSRPDLPESRLPPPFGNKNLDAERRRPTELQVFEQTLLFLISDLHSMLRSGSAPASMGLVGARPAGIGGSTGNSSSSWTQPNVAYGNRLKMGGLSGRQPTGAGGRPSLFSCT